MSPDTSQMSIAWTVKKHVSNNGSSKVKEVEWIVCHKDLVILAKDQISNYYCWPKKSMPQNVWVFESPK